MQDRSDVRAKDSFGGPHAAGCNFVFCDGSVRIVGYEIAMNVYALLGSRNDGIPFDAEELNP